MRCVRRQAGANALGPRSRGGLSGRCPLARPGPRRLPATRTSVSAAATGRGPYLKLGRDRHRPPDSVHARRLRREHRLPVGRPAAHSIPALHLAAALDARASGAISGSPGLAGGDQRRARALPLDPHRPRHSAGVANPPGDGDRPPSTAAPGASSVSGMRGARLHEEAPSSCSPASIAAQPARSSKPSRRLTGAIPCSVGRSRQVISWPTSTGRSPERSPTSGKTRTSSPNTTPTTGRPSDARWKRGSRGTRWTSSPASSR